MALPCFFVPSKNEYFLCVCVLFRVLYKDRKKYFRVRLVNKHAGEILFLHKFQTEA